MKKLLLLIAILLFFLILLVAYPLLHDTKQTASPSATDTAAFKTMTVKASTENILITLPSYLDALNITPLWGRTNGYLNNFLVDIGDKVKAGDLLAIVDTPDTDEEFARAQGELSAFLAKEAIALITAERWTELYQYNPEAVSKEEVDQTVSAYQAASGDVAAAEANVERLRYLQDFKYIYAPFDGTIVQRNTDIGDLITAGNLNNPRGLFHIARTDILRAFIDVPQSAFYLIKDGIDATITVWQYPSCSFKGVVTRNASALDSKARTLLTQVNIDNSSGTLMPGLYAQVELSIPPQMKTYLVPISALIIRTGPPCIAIVQPNHTVILKPVKINRDFGSTLEIFDGLSEGDTILTNPTDRVQNHTPITTTPLSPQEEAMLMGRSSFQ